MRTVVTRSPAEAAAFIRRGELVAFPTETVYGLGADAFDATAVAKIFEAKQRPPDNPLIVHVASVDGVRTVARSVPPAAEALISAFFPGPLTIVLPRRPEIPDIVTAGLDTVGVRMPRHPVALALLEACGRPLCAPSANRSGRPSPTHWRAVLDDLDGRIACVLAGDSTEIGVESTVVDATGDEVLLLRAGGLPVETLRRVVPVRVDGEASALLAGRSPGMRYRHYAPRARVVPAATAAGVQASPNAAFIGLHAPDHPGTFGKSIVLPDVEAYARELFAFFRACDEAGIDTIVCELPPPLGLGRALRDRIERAARAASLPG